MNTPQDFAARIAATTADHHPDMPRVVRYVDKCISTSQAQPIVVPAPRWGDMQAAVQAAVQVYRDAGWHVVYPTARPDDVLMVLSTTTDGLDEWRPDAAGPAPTTTTDEAVFLVDEDSTDRDDSYAEIVTDTIAVFARRQDADAYCRACESTGSRSEFSVRAMPLRVGPAAVYAARANGELISIHRRMHDAHLACMDKARCTASGGTYAVTAHRDGEDSTTPWSRTYSAAEAAELKERYIEISMRLGPQRTPWAAVDEIIAGGC